jgi:hypothetical protein
MRGKRLWILCFSVALLGLFAFAKLHVGDSQQDTASGLALTVYNQNFAVVRQPIALDLQAGLNSVRYSDTTAHVEPDSVMLRDPSGAHKLRILEQNYRNDPVTEARLLAAYEGKEIEFEVTRDGKPQIIKAKIIRSGYVPHYNAFQQYGQQYQYAQMTAANYDSGGGSPIVEVGGQIQFGLPGRPIFPSLLNDSLMKPTLDWMLRSDSAGKVDAALSYVTGGMTWAADYNAVAPENGNDLDITGWVTMDNQSGKTFDHAQIKLMAGEVNKIQPANGRFDRTSFAGPVAVGTDGQQVREKAFDEYHLYTLPRPVTLHDRETKQVEFIRASNVKAQHVYVYDGAKINPQWLYWGYEQIRNYREYGTEMNTDVWVMQEIKNSKANNLGMPCPKVGFAFTAEIQTAHLSSSAKMRSSTRQPMRPSASLLVTRSTLWASGGKPTFRPTRMLTKSMSHSRSNCAITRRRQPRYASSSTSTAA